MIKPYASRGFIALLLLALAGTAQAHPGHGGTFFASLTHPFTGLDHLLAMVAVGVWSVAALPAEKRLFGPVVFLSMLLMGLLLTHIGVALPMAGVEMGVALSTTLFGVMLLAGRQLPVLPGLMMVGLAASLHGIAHGAELSSPGITMFITTAGAMVLGSSVLHALGLYAGTRLLTLPRAATRWVSMLLASTGVLMLVSRI